MTKQQLNESRKKTYEVRIWLMIDIITGAVLGSAVGYLIPSLHVKRDKKSKVSIISSGNTLGLVYRF